MICSYTVFMSQIIRWPVLRSSAPAKSGYFTWVDWVCGYGAKVSATHQPKFGSTEISHSLSSHSGM